MNLWTKTIFDGIHIYKYKDTHLLEFDNKCLLQIKAVLKSLKSSK